MLREAPKGERIRIYLHDISLLKMSHEWSHQWRNEAPGAPATPGGAVIRGRQIVIKMWDNFARLTALLAKVRVLFNNSTI